MSGMCSENEKDSENHRTTQRETNTRCSICWCYFFHSWKRQKDVQVSLSLKWKKCYATTGDTAFIQRPELTRCYDGLVTLTHSKIMWEGRLDLRIIWIRLACGNICGAVLTALIGVGRPGVRVRGAIPWIWTLGSTEVEKLRSSWFLFLSSLSAPT